jgi:hypothetical protein
MFESIEGKQRTMTPDEVWKDDVLGRRIEAEQLIGYVESISGRMTLREDGHAQTIAVDAGYGEGKTFFLRRLEMHLAINHPVAFVDAWADDIADDPLTAIVATLEDALGDLLKKAPVKKRWESVLKKTGEVAKIAAKGLVKRGVGLLITTAATEAIGGALEDNDASVRASVADEIKSIGKDTVAGAENTLIGVAPNKLMRERIADFKRGQLAIRELKDSLRALVSSLDNNSLHQPIVVIVDEMDRCRPTYAIKLLEEVKHLFDVPGLVFIFGMHGEQLSHAIRAAYGPEFDGRSYLRRFIGRRYRLATPEKGRLVQQQLKNSGIEFSRLRFPTADNGNSFKDYPPDQMIGRYVNAYGVSAREIFHLIDILQTCAALTENAHLLMAYLLPLAIGQLKGLESGALPSLKDGTGGGRYGFHDREGKHQSETFRQFAENLKSVAGNPPIEIRANRNASVAYGLVHELEAEYPSVRLAHPRNYPELLETVSRFSHVLIDRTR